MKLIVKTDLYFRSTRELASMAEEICKDSSLPMRHSWKRVAECGDRSRICT
jgi:hypothetical protein